MPSSEAEDAEYREYVASQMLDEAVGDMRKEQYEVDKFVEKEREFARHAVSVRTALSILERATLLVATLVIGAGVFGAVTLSNRSSTIALIVTAVTVVTAVAFSSVAASYVTMRRRAAAARKHEEELRGYLDTLLKQ